MGRHGEGGMGRQGEREMGRRGETEIGDGRGGEDRARVRRTGTLYPPLSFQSPISVSPLLPLSVSPRLPFAPSPVSLSPVSPSPNLRVHLYLLELIPGCRV